MTTTEKKIFRVNLVATTYNEMYVRADDKESAWKLATGLIEEGAHESIIGSDNGEEIDSVEEVAESSVDIENLTANEEALQELNEEDDE